MTLPLAPFEITKMGHPVLRQPAQVITDFNNPRLHQVIRRMKLTIEHLEQRIDSMPVGLAAPQVGIDWSLFLFQVPHMLNEGKPEVPLTVVINPSCTPVGQSTALEWEACYSLPELAGEVQRFERIKCKYQTIDGTWIKKEMSGFEARVFQHETDHLYQHLIIDRMPDLKSLGYVTELRKNAKLKSRHKKDK